MMDDVVLKKATIEDLEAVQIFKSKVYLKENLRSIINY